MPELPETLRDTFTPAELLRRMEELRRRHRQGMLGTAEFNAALSAFQFNDEVGHLWTPGANSGKWYRWDRTQWTPATPPQTLQLAHSQLETSAAWITTAEAAAAADACTACGAPLEAASKFCPGCGRPVTRNQPPMTSASSNNASACAACGEALNPGAKFCAGCGKVVAGQASMPTAPQPRRCPNPECRKTIAPGKKFCTGCGTMAV